MHHASGLRKQRLERSFCSSIFPRVLDIRE
jgi:hypothetical protein